MKKVRNIKKLRFKKDEMILLLDDKELRLKLAEVSPNLLKANKKERETFKVSPSGYGIHWPLIDEDLSVEGLMKYIGENSAAAKTR